MLFLLVAVLCALLLVYPYILYPLTLSFFKKVPIACRGSRRRAVTSALVFCAYNEQKSLPEKINNIREIKKNNPTLDVVAYSDNSSDLTDEMLTEASDVIRLIRGTSRVGKATGMKRIVATLTADVIIFTDANVILEPGAVPRLLSYFEDSEIACVAGHLHYVNSGDSVTSGIGSLYWRLEEWIKQRESTTGSTLGADGSIFATRRAYYPDVPCNLLDDMCVSMNPLFLGKRVVSATDVVAFERAATSARDEFNRKRRIACRAFRTHMHLRKEIRSLNALMRYKYYSHKFLRWFGIVPLFIGSLSFLASVFLLCGVSWFFFVVVVVLALVAIGKVACVPVVSQIVEILSSVVATGIGVFEGIGGKDYTTWQPAESRG